MTKDPRSLGEALARLSQHARVTDDADDWDRVQGERNWKQRIPLRFHNATMQDVQEPARSMLEQWASQAPGPTTNVVVVGPVGVGKTHAAVAALRICHEHGLLVAFAPIVEVLDALRPGGPSDATDKLMHARVLLLDDLGAEKPTEWTAERLYAIVNRRWLNKLPTIVTTNVPAHELEHTVDIRLYSRLVHEAVAIHVGGNDRRRTQ